MCDICEQQVNLIEREWDSMQTAWRALTSIGEVRDTRAERVHDLTRNVYEEPKIILAGLVAMLIEDSICQPEQPVQPAQKHRILLSDSQCEQLSDIISKRRREQEGTLTPYRLVSRQDVREIVSAVNELAHELTT